MFLRWIGRKHTRRCMFGEEWKRDRRGRLLRDRKTGRRIADGKIRWQAALVKSERVDGKPRHRHIAVLGSITEDMIERVHSRRMFWNRAHERLDACRLSPADRRCVEDAIALKVSRLSREEHEASVAESIAFLGGEEWVDCRPYRDPA